jgi:hypothetical protein
MCQSTRELKIELMTILTTFGKMIKIKPLLMENKSLAVRFNNYQKVFRMNFLKSIFTKNTSNFFNKHISEFPNKKLNLERVNFSLGKTEFTEIS